MRAAKPSSTSNRHVTWRAAAAAVVLAGVAGCGGGDRDMEGLATEIRSDYQSQVAGVDAKVRKLTCIDESNAKAQCFGKVRAYGTTYSVAIDVTFDRKGDGYIWKVTD